MSVMIKEYCKTYNTYQKSKFSIQIPKRELHSLLILDEYWDSISMDFLTLPIVVTDPPLIYNSIRQFTIFKKIYPIVYSLSKYTIPI